MNELLGKSVLVGITCVDYAGTEIDRFETFGRVEIANDRIIGVRREGWPELFGLPPAPELFEPAEAGTYTLHPSGTQVENPDYVARLSVTCIDPEALLEIRGVGFVPAGR